MIAPESTTGHIFPMELFTIDDSGCQLEAVLGRCIVVLTAAWFPDRFTRLPPCTVLQQLCYFNIHVLRSSHKKCRLTSDLDSVVNSCKVPQHTAQPQSNIWSPAHLQAILDSDWSTIFVSQTLPRPSDFWEMKYDYVIVSAILAGILDVFDVPKVVKIERNPFFCSFVFNLAFVFDYCNYFENSSVIMTTYHRVRLTSFNTETGRRAAEFLAESSDLFIYFLNGLFVDTLFWMLFGSSAI